MLEDVHSLTEDLYKDVLDQYKKWYIEAEGDRIVNKLIDDWEREVHDTIDNYVVVELREQEIWEDPSFEEEKKWWEEEWEDRVWWVMWWVDASLNDMKLFVKDIIKNG
jgi:hypothetical protein